MNLVALVYMVALGILLPLMEVVFSKFVTIFNNFSIGNLLRNAYMA